MIVSARIVRKRKLQYTALSVRDHRLSVMSVVVSFIGLLLGVLIELLVRQHTSSFISCYLKSMLRTEGNQLNLPFKSEAETNGIEKFSVLSPDSTVCHYFEIRRKGKF